ncbi:uncharacterized protein BXIN_2571 [Babesia sp. Xinjiang]|uniref:uncharacterized protein n=1 Tax=Babesia sp. Xinjiang TaxID=462227 RepID=UPI000A249872|nr:uncharacterized protein BXIN_2571 [Babesia sp. Xinjiang]ORM41415.1 hypothetical protein BXIN_2571 [Babesia sp. Xinjiang]
MKCSFGYLKVAVCALVSINYIFPIEGCILDVSQTAFPPHVDIFEGKFGRGGIYRMFHSKCSTIRLVTYGDRILSILKHRNAVVRDVYVQVYTIDNHTIISITRVLGDNNRTYTSFHEVIGTTVKFSSRRVKESIVTSPISLRLDIDTDKVHPFIATICGCAEHRFKTWSVLPSHKNYLDEGTIARLRNGSGVFVISPVINIDKQFRNRYSPPTSLSSFSNEVRVSPTGETVTIWIKYMNALKPFLILIPPVEMGIFKPANIFRNPYVFAAQCPHGDLSRPVGVTIDISSKESDVEHLVVLADLRRGCWLYTQYSLVPLLEQSLVSVTVMNSENYQIYKVTPDSIVTHVEVFNHVKHGWQYVVVNIKKLEGHDALDIQKVYKRIDVDGGLAYFDLDNFWSEPYLDMLYNIDTLDTCNDYNGTRDILQEAFQPIGVPN